MRAHTPPDRPRHRRRLPARLALQRTARSAGGRGADRPGAACSPYLLTYLQTRDETTGDEDDGGSEDAHRDDSEAGAPPPRKSKKRRVRCGLVADAAEGGTPVRVQAR